MLNLIGHDFSNKRLDRLVIYKKIWLPFLFFFLATISANAKSISPPNPQKNDTTATSKSSLTIEAEWKYIRSTTWRYKQDNVLNASTEIFSLQLWSIAEVSFENREENGGWAGLFVRNNLFLICQDIEKRYKEWCIPFQSKEQQEKVLSCVPPLLVLALSIDDPFTAAQIATQFVCVCSAIELGKKHFQEHVTPFFYQTIKELLLNALKAKQLNRTKLVFNAIKQIETEHEKFLEEAVEPSLEASVPSRFFQLIAQEQVSLKARTLRNSTVRRVIKEFYETEIISLQEYSELMKTLSDLPGTIR